MSKKMKLFITTAVRTINHTRGFLFEGTDVSQTALR
jgi:hypothetical protein